MGPPPCLNREYLQVLVICVEECMGITEYMCRSSVLDIVTDVLPLYDLICFRALLFTKRCLSSDSDVVRYVASYGLQYGRISSIHGSNIQFCCERFLQNQNELLGKTFDKKTHLCCLHK